MSKKNKVILALLLLMLVLVILVGLFFVFQKKTGPENKETVKKSKQLEVNNNGTTISIDEPQPPAPQIPSK